MTGAPPPSAPTLLDLGDIQGGILRNYGRSFAKGRSFFLTVRDGAKGRALVDALRPSITTAARWIDPEDDGPPPHRGHPRIKDLVRDRGHAVYPGEAQRTKPRVTINVAFTWPGLAALGVPAATLRTMPGEFIDGMAARASLLGDEPFLDKRDLIWRNSHGERMVHILVTMFAQMKPDGTPCEELAQATALLERLCGQSGGGVVLLDGVDAQDARWQDMAALLDRSGGDPVLSNREHFGFADGFGDPVFSGQFPPQIEALRVQGGGKLLPDLSWAPLATGEFLLGYADEGQEQPPAALPDDFSRNGSFVAYRKLYENVAAFDNYIAVQADRYVHAMGVSPEEASATIRAKMVGRWPDGVPLMAAPTFAEWRAFDTALQRARADGDKAVLARLALAFTNFHYTVDPAGVRCPVTAHMRRANPRDQLGPSFDAAGNSAVGSSIVDRRRILRRGMPYGPCEADAPPTDAEQGIVFIAMCGSLSRQFEFVQQQWMQYSLDFDAGSDTCPIIGNHLDDDRRKQVIPADPSGGKPPFILDRLPQFVEPRGGDYFFMPGMTALRMIAMGVVDPT